MYNFGCLRFWYSLFFPSNLYYLCRQFILHRQNK
nr:MAG TPA: hypothetical protein [Caudoviricetes sp.]